MQAYGMSGYGLRSAFASAAVRVMRKTRLQSALSPSGGGTFTSFQRANSANSAKRSESLCRFRMAAGGEFRPADEGSRGVL
jgi:hypothetical protein